MVDARCCVLAVLAAAACTAASAADLPLPAPAPFPVDASMWAMLDRFYVHVGPTALIIDAGAKIYTPAGRVPGGTIKIAPQVTAGAEIGYRMTDNWAMSLGLGVPPTADIDAAGSVRPLGRFGDTVYGPISATLHYHLTTLGAFQPYIGFGPTLMIDFGSSDAALKRLSVHSSVGVLGQVGADYMLNDHLGLFVDLKKAYLRTEATGHLGGTPIYADVKLDPYVVSGGMTYRF